MAQEPNKSEQLGTAENLAKYAPEYKQKDLAYFSTPEENSIIRNRMAKENGRQYFIDGIEYEHGDVSQPNRKIDIYISSNTDPTDDREIDENSHYSTDDLMNYGDDIDEQQVIHTDEKTALKFFKDIDARPNQALMNDKWGVGVNTDLLSYNHGNTFRYSPSFISKDLHPTEQTIKHHDFKKNEPYSDYEDNEYEISDDYRKESQNFFAKYERRFKENQSIPSKVWNGINEAPREQQDAAYNQYKEQVANHQPLTVYDSEKVLRDKQQQEFENEINAGSEMIGTNANLNKYAPEYKNDKLNFLNTDRERELISNRMQLAKEPKKDKRYWIESLSMDKNHLDKYSLPYIEINVATNHVPVNTEISKENISKPAGWNMNGSNKSLDGLYRPKKPILLRADQTDRMLKYLGSQEQFDADQLLKNGKQEFKPGQEPQFDAPDAPGFHSDGTDVKPDITKMKPLEKAFTKLKRRDYETKPHQRTNQPTTAHFTKPLSVRKAIGVKDDQTGNADHKNLLDDLNTASTKANKITKSPKVDKGNDLHL